MVIDQLLKLTHLYTISQQFAEITLGRANVNVASHRRVALNLSRLVCFANRFTVASQLSTGALYVYLRGVAIARIDVELPTSCACGVRRVYRGTYERQAQH